MPKLNQAGIDLIKEFEGFKGQAYRCPAGVWTVGYGHTSRAGWPRVFPNTVVSKDVAEEILKIDLKRFEEDIKNTLGESVNSLNDNQYSALVSLCYNIGSGAFAKSSAVKLIRAGKIEEAAQRILPWNKAGGKVLKGLVRRRKAEYELYLS